MLVSNIKINPNSVKSSNPEITSLKGKFNVKAPPRAFQLLGIAGFLTMKPRDLLRIFRWNFL